MAGKHHAMAVGVALLLLTTVTSCSAAIAGTARRGPTDTAPSPSGGGDPTTVDVAGTVTIDANVRAGPGMDYDILTSLPSGAQVTVSCASGEWLRLAAPHAGGFVYNSLLSLRSTPNPC